MEQKLSEAQESVIMAIAERRERIITEANRAMGEAAKAFATVFGLDPERAMIDQRPDGLYVIEREEKKEGE